MIKAGQPRRKTEGDTLVRFEKLLDDNRKLREENSVLRRNVAALEERIEIDQRARDEQNKQREERFARRTDAFRLRHPDYDEVLRASFVPDFILPELLQLENGPEMAYLLGKQPALCQELVDMRPYAALAKLRSIAKFVELRDLQQSQQVKAQSDVAKWYVGGL